MRRRDAVPEEKEHSADEQKRRIRGSSLTTILKIQNYRERPSTLRAEISEHEHRFLWLFLIFG